jgi:dephospho-CoA kinase
VFCTILLPRAHGTLSHKSREELSDAPHDRHAYGHAVGGYGSHVRILGLTGGIGAGKSAVAQRLAQLGAIVIDSDALAREVVEPGTDGLAAVVAEFGPDVLRPDGALDRPALGRIVFGDPSARARLERIVHPLVRARSVEIVASADPAAVIVNDVPLLVENDLQAAYEIVIVVEAAESVRVARLVEDRGMTESDAHARIAAQATDEQRRAVADVVITNDGTRDELNDRVDAVWRDRLQSG